MWHHPSDAMERSGSAESAPTYQTVNLNISNITVQARKAGSSFSGTRLTIRAMNLLEPQLVVIKRPCHQIAKAIGTLIVPVKS